ncbi:MAG: hypothetical protein FJZ57_08745 [Chlamydiae bacterium]|nr:hypothetical protein [Chlamydiota bacterium]
MSLATSLHNTIMRYNVLSQATQNIKEHFDYHPNAFKVALIANHIFRAAAMTGFMLAMPLSFPASLGVCFASSLFYRLTVEQNCAYKFAMPALGGSIAFLFGQNALTNLISGVAFASLEALSSSLIAVLPLGLYAAYVILTVSYDVDNRPCPLCTSNNNSSA